MKNDWKPVLSAIVFFIVAILAYIDIMVLHTNISNIILYLFLIAIFVVTIKSLYMIIFALDRSDLRITCVAGTVFGTIATIVLPDHPFTTMGILTYLINYPGTWIMIIAFMMIVSFAFIRLTMIVHDNRTLVQ